MRTSSRNATWASSTSMVVFMRVEWRHYETRAIVKIVAVRASARCDIQIGSPELEHPNGGLYGIMRRYYYG